MCDGTALALHALHRVSGSLVLDPHRLVKGRLVEPWLWVGIPISTLVGERGVCIFIYFIIFIYSQSRGTSQ